MDPKISEALKASLLAGPKAVETTYTLCRHVVTTGGNVADPSALILKSLGHVEYQTERGTCGMCHLFDRLEAEPTSWGSMPPNSGGGPMRG